jgi:putative transposase
LPFKTNAARRHHIPKQKHRVSAHDQIANLFHLRRDHVTASEHRAARARTFQVWADVSEVTAAA